ncbi:MAG TPA: metallophosphoesterase, partial [Capsulimonadaceae bacterium]|nr:metallophosphoesterase [Capsulimonadaceae bacterium]
MTNSVIPPAPTTNSEEPASPSRRRFLKLALSAAAFAGTLGAAHGVDTEDLTLEDHKIAIKGWPESAAGLKIGHLSDFHVDCDLARHRTERAVAMLLAQKPDIVFVTGDFVTYKPHQWAHVCAGALRPLANVPGGAFGVLGNHDWWSNGRNLVARHMEEAGITM